MKKHYGILAILLILSMIVTTGCRPAGKSRRAIQREMKEYLEAEYNSPAHVKRPVLSGNTGFGYNKYTAEAYLENDPDIKFYVSYHISSGIFTAGYHTVRIESEGRRAMYNQITKYYNPDDILQMNFMIIFPSGLVRTEDMTYESLVKEHRGSFKISLSYRIAMEEYNEEIEAEKIRRLLEEFIQEYDLDSLDLIVYFWNEEYREDYINKYSRQMPPNPIEMGMAFANFYISGRNTEDFDINNLSKHFRYTDPRGGK